MQELKECPFCGEQIKSKAKKCPHCQTWQSKWRFDQSNLKHQFILLALVLGIMALLFSQSLGNIFNPKDFKDHKALLEVKNSNISFADAACGKRVTIIGTILNKDSVAWKNVNFEVRFFNKGNDLIDALSDQNYQLILLPNENSAFKVSGAADKPVEEYHHYKVIIKSAREAGVLF